MSQKRSRTGCMNCRRKKKKCDEGKPACFNCIKTSERCKWNRPLSFLPQNTFTINEDDTLATLSGTAEYAGGNSTLMQNSESNIAERDGRAQHSEYVAPQPSADVVVETASPASRQQHVATREMSNMSSLPSYHQMSKSPMSSNSFTDGRSTRLYPAPSSDINHSMQERLLAFESPLQSNHFVAPVVVGPEFQLSPDMLTDDGIFIPGSTYQELHSTLRHHVFNTARSQEPSRQSSPSREPRESHIESHTAPEIGIPAQLDDHSTSEAEVLLDADQEYRLWKNWVTEIADWLDKFDRDRHFGQKLPVMAKTCPHLRYSMLALSARQLERKDKSIPAPVTLSLYSAAVHLLLPELHRRDTAVLASCVVICVLEMMSCSPKAWRRHLDGCACLILSMNICGDSEGIERALFWCFARMDVCGGLISKERTLIPTTKWTSHQSFEGAVRFFSTRLTVDWSASYASYLSACTVNLLFSPSASNAPHSPTYQRQEGRSFTERWKQLFAVIEEWYDIRPPEMLPIVSHNTTGAQPFPTLLFGGGAAISGNQLHHTAAMLMLQNIPHGVKRPRAHSILWHARRICGISICNLHHGCWTNAVQPLWLAGQVMSHYTEHRAIVDIYERIEKETGWGATWRADDLRQFWGEIE